jgi:hypothetical protein
VTSLLNLAQSGSGQGGDCSVPKKEREIRSVDFRVVYWLLLCPGTFPTVTRTLVRVAGTNREQSGWIPTHTQDTF